MTHFFASDLHLGHANIIEHCDRPFDDVEEMNATLIENWNDCVDSDDRVTFLGDLGRFADDDELRKWLDRLNGRIVFVKGNHDHPDPEPDGVNTHQYYLQELAGYELCCTHRPENAPRFWEGWIVHGHHHNNDLEEFPFFDPDARCVNMSIELLGYEPLSLQTLVDCFERGERLETAP